MQLKLNSMKQLQPKSSKSLGGSFGSLLAAALFATLAAVIFLNRQFVVDNFWAATFTPSSSIVEAGKRSGLNDLGQFYLKASRAEISQRDQFNQACGNLQREKTIVLGCYTNPDKRIYVYDVADSQLDGVKETSLAHEMLHAAYDRLSSSERERVDRLTSDQAKNITNPRLLEVIEHYRQVDPSIVSNELHSIIGTEIRSISPELESYYSKYFSDRQAVVALKEKYEKVFTDLTNKQQSLVNELNELGASIVSRRAQYDTDYAALNRDVEAFRTWASSDSAVESEYDSRRSLLQGRITNLNNERTAINTLVNEYNSKKVQLDQLNLQAISLNQSIDSSLAPAPSL